MKRMRYQPSKGQSIFTGIVGVCFCLIGFFLVIPSAGAFGLRWTGVAVYITVHSFMMAAGKAKMGSYVIEDEEQKKPAGSAEERLLELQNLYDRRLITDEEYEAKRKEILEEL